MHAPGIAGPVAPGAEYLFDDVAHAAVPARELRNVARGFDHLGRGIRGTDGDSDCFHTLQVRDVVAHVDNVRRIESVACEEILHGRYFVHAVQVNICESQHFEPVVERCAPSARDDAHFVTHTERIDDGIAVLGIVFSDEIPIDQGHDSPSVITPSTSKMNASVFTMSSLKFPIYLDLMIHKFVTVADRERVRLRAAATSAGRRVRQARSAPDADRPNRRLWLRFRRSGFQYVEGQFGPVQNLASQCVEVIDEIAGENRGQVKAYATVGVGTIYRAAQIAGERFELRGEGVVVSFDEKEVFWQNPRCGLG